MAYAVQDRQRGLVKRFNEQKGYGFIVPDDGTTDIFFHFKGISGPNRVLEERQRVSYIVVQGKKGQRATDVIPTVF